MSLDKAIIHGKEFREQYRKSKAFDRSCRNHGSCSYCEGNRTYKHKKVEYFAELDVQEYLKEELDEISE